MATSTEAEKARQFARRYVSLVEALQQEGVPEDKAREEARIAAVTELAERDEEDLLPKYEPHLGPCPTCRRG